ncbi:MOP flippase family protein [Myroides odoratimimus]|uniref:MOP flippase family protein n=1 Tax=Myroides odoratimimus TaxID=76832 RepID=UPI0025789BD9|nr:MOP flippase family protein [Myroides odoratimimus]MDM1527399.1 MOP flippase family protein [Myroides odoratimimus]
MDLKKSAVKGVKWTTLSSIIVSVIQVLQIIILTKLLKPSDFGLMAIVVFILNFSQIFIDLGVSNVIIYKNDITKKQLSTLYWLNILIGIFLFFVIFFSSNGFGYFYNDIRLVPLVKIIALIFLIIPFGQQFQVLLKKELNFKSLAIRDIISRISSFFVVVALAYFGFGVYALVYGSVFYSFLNTILVLIIGFKIHRPTFYFKLSIVLEFFNFGLFQMGEKIVNYFNKEVDTLIIGRLLGMEALGVYNLAKDFISKPYLLINPIITKVSFPVMSKLNGDVIKIKGVYLKTLRLLTLLNAIIFSFCFFFSKEVILLFFGSQWLEASVPLSILSIYMLIRSVGNPAGSLQLSVGRADLGFYWNLIVLFTVPLLVYVGSFWGIIGICSSLLIGQILLYIPSWKYMVNKLVPITLKEYNGTQYPYFVLSFISCLPAFMFFYFFEINNTVRFLIAGFTSVFIYLYFVYSFMKDDFNYIYKIFKK